MGSASETEYLVLLAHDLKYLTADQHTELIDATIRVKKMLTALLKNVRMNSRPAPTTDNWQLTTNYSNERFYSCRKPNLWQGTC